MFEIKNNIIKITKGDSASIRVKLTNVDGSVYEMQSGDVLTMTVRKTVDSDILFQVSSTSNLITLTPSNTEKLEIGNCVFDIQLQTSSGSIFTVVGLTDSLIRNMTVYPEVTV